jgi:hypothetical protein
MGYIFSHSRRPQELQIRMSRNFPCTTILTVDKFMYKYIGYCNVYVFYHLWDLTARIKENLTFRGMIAFLTWGLVNYEKEERGFSVNR